VTHMFAQDGGLKADQWTKLSRVEVEEKVREISQAAVTARENEIGPEVFPQLQRMILLQMIDVAWKEHLYDLDQLKKGISLRAYAQKDPLIEFQHEAFGLFTQMMSRIREQTVEYIFKVHVAPPVESGVETPAMPFAPRSVFTRAKAEKPEFDAAQSSGGQPFAPAPDQTPFAPTRSFKSSGNDAPEGLPGSPRAPAPVASP